MQMMNRARFVALLLAVSPALAQDRVPGEVWMRYRTPEEAGFASAQLAEAEALYDSLAAAGADRNREAGDHPRPAQGVVPGMDSIPLAWLADRWWVVSITTEFEQPAKPLPERFLK